jgi:hypothetical protein
MHRSIYGKHQGVAAMADGPRPGVRIIDLTSVVVGLLATQIMANHGADVIKVAAPSGNIARNLAGRGRNPNMCLSVVKRLLALAPTQTLPLPLRHNTYSLISPFYSSERFFMPLILKRFSFALAFIAAAALSAANQAQNKDYTPSVGQEGKDVIWVPTPNELIQKMLDMAKLTPSDVHFDLGSGDGRTVIAAAKRGTKAIGIEYNPDMVELSKRAAQKENAAVAARTEFVRGDIFETDFSKATVLTLYLLPSLNLKLRPTILNMKPGTRVVSHAFTMGEWEADQTDTADGRTAYLWIVPAKVEGNWRIEGGGDIALKQTFQKLDGTLGGTAGGKAITNASLRGDMIAFSVDGREYSGKVSGDRMEGSVKGSMSGKWSATRVK